MGSRTGFSLTEALVSIAIVAIIASITTVTLVSTGRTDELNTASRVLAADLRSMQSRALSTQNIKTCTNGAGIGITCESSALGCASACTLRPPAAIGARFVTGANNYDYFAEVGTTSSNWIFDAGDQFLNRAFDKSGAPRVTISAIDRGSPSSIAFERQNGAPVFNGCRVSQGCITTTSMTITLRHTQSNATKTVMINASGRISIQ